MTSKEFNDWRIIPRVLMLSYYFFFAWAFWGIADWFMGFDFDSITEPSVALAVAGFPMGILGVLSAVLASLTKNYFETGGTK